jgi:adenylate cyclase
MTIFNEITTAQKMNLLVAFFDLTGFARFSQNHLAREVFDLLSHYYELVGDIVEGSGGKVVKFIGDAGLIVYPANDANRGILALKALQETGDAWLADHNMPSRHIIKAHFGPVVCGQVGTRSDKRFDLFGETVNIAATLKSNGFAMTPQAFRKLDADTRKLFKKHTPPITYIPLVKVTKTDNC